MQLISPPTQRYFIASQLLGVPKFHCKHAHLFNCRVAPWDVASLTKQHIHDKYHLNLNHILLLHHISEANITLIYFKALGYFFFLHFI